MHACIILHNTIVEDERDSYENLFDLNFDESPLKTPPVEISRGAISDFQVMLRINVEIRDKNIHHNLQADLIEHIWSKFRNHV